MLVPLSRPVKLGTLQSKTRACHDPAKLPLREDREARRKQRTLEAAVKCADAGVHKELVEILVERRTKLVRSGSTLKVREGTRLEQEEENAKAKAKAEEAESLQ